MVAAGLYVITLRSESPTTHITYPRTAERTHTTPAASMTVVDGDSLRAGNEDIRLDGVDAPELRQTCIDEGGREWPCGRAARQHLRALIAHAVVSCPPRGRDRYGRTLAVCSAGGVADIGEAMVRDGYAVNYDRFTSRYATAEAQARAAKRGIWRGRFERPEDWRAGNRRREAVGWSEH